MKLENRTALVTGSNRGIGKALVEALIARGAKRVYAAARNTSQIVRTDRIIPVTLDITNSGAVTAAASELRDVDIIFNNAGVLSAGGLLDSPIEDLRRNLETNLFGTLAVTRAFHHQLIERPSTAVVNLLTVVSLASMPGLGAYSASKAAAWSMTQALRADLGKKGVSVFAVFPGPVDTEMAKDIQLPKTAPADVARAILEAMEKDELDIFPDVMSKQIQAMWLKNANDLAPQFASM